MPGDITCVHCGWRNDATARMCGGCGQPLHQPAVPGATVATPAGWASGPEPGATTPANMPAAYPPTMVAPAAVYTPPPAPAPYRAAPSVWPGVAQAGQHPGAKLPATRNPWRVPVILLVILCVLIAATLGAWALVLRPAIHTNVDSQLRAALDTAIVQAAPAGQNIPQGTVITITIPASALNADIQNELTGVPVQNVQVHFQGAGYVLSGYTFLGRDGTILTQLVPLANGRVQAQGTTVTGMLQLVENNDEMSAAFNEALSRLPPDYHVTGITAANDILTISVTGQS